MWVNVEAGSVRFYSRKHEHLLPLSEVSGVTATDGKHISTGRVLATGAVGLLWKASDHYLVLNYRQAGLDLQAVLKGDQRQLGKLQQELVREKAALS